MTFQKVLEIVLMVGSKLQTYVPLAAEVVAALQGVARALRPTDQAGKPVPDDVIDAAVAAAFSGARAPWQHVVETAQSEVNQ